MGAPMLTLSLLLITSLFRGDEKEKGSSVCLELGPDGAGDKLLGFDLNTLLA